MSRREILFHASQVNMPNFNHSSTQRRLNNLTGDFNMLKTLRAFHDDDSGAAAIETVIIAAAAVGLATVVAATFDFGGLGAGFAGLTQGGAGGGIVGDALANDLAGY